MYVLPVPSPCPQPLMSEGALNRERLTSSLGTHGVINAGAGKKCSVSSAGKGSWRRVGKKTRRRQAAGEEGGGAPGHPHPASCQQHSAPVVTPVFQNQPLTRASPTQLPKSHLGAIKAVKSGFHPQRPLLHWPGCGLWTLGF